MDIQVSFKINEKLFLKDPESTELGKSIVKNAIDLIYKLGYEQFTFKKLAQHIQTTEATVYRYFENKHRLLLYILNWYWSYMEYLVLEKLQKEATAEQQLKTIIHLLTHELPESSSTLDYSKKFLNAIAIAEGRKVYFVKEVDAINQLEVFKPFKELCAQIAMVISRHNPKYSYPYSLSSTMIETAHDQQFFSEHLPRLTDIKKSNQQEFTANFLEELVFKVLN
jgi:AcrR family transcriptional regulator